MRAFDRKLRRFSDTKPLIVAVQVDFQSGWSTAKVGYAEAVPLSLSVLIGESVFHARASLEHLVWALVKANHKAPGEHNSFPIERSRRQRPFVEYQCRPPSGRDKGGKLRGVNKKAVALIESLQPYHAANPANHLLTVLDVMAANDRHRALHAAYSGGRGPDYKGMVDLAPLFIPFGRRYRIVEFRNRLRHGQRVVAGTELAWFRVEPLTRKNKVRVEGDLPKFIAFGNREIGFVYAQQFKTINREVRKTLRLFEEFL
jgi:hypothetical protein